MCGLLTRCLHLSHRLFLHRPQRQPDTRVSFWRSLIRKEATDVDKLHVNRRTSSHVHNRVRLERVHRDLKYIVGTLAGLVIIGARTMSSPSLFGVSRAIGSHLNREEGVVENDTTTVVKTAESKLRRFVLWLTFTRRHD